MYLGFSNATESKRVHREAPIDNNFLHSDNVLRLRFLASTSTESKRVRREVPIDNNLPPRYFQHPVGRNCCLTGLLSLLTLSYFHQSFLIRKTAQRIIKRIAITMVMIQE